MASSSLEAGIELINQAVCQDSSRNFEEAARCYREAIVAFRTVAESKQISPRVRNAIEEKLCLYEARLRKLERHLFLQADLSTLYRECVKSQQPPDERQIVAEDSSSELLQNPYLKCGLEKIVKAKREDANGHLQVAIVLYEQGTGLLLDAVRNHFVSASQADLVRVKCLLIHDRCELIRNHLEYGSPLKVRKATLGSFENSLEGSNESGSPLPLLQEEHDLLMEEIQSNYSYCSLEDDNANTKQTSTNVIGGPEQGSTHSLYPMCYVEMGRRTQSIDSNNSDFLLVNTKIPLADLDQELNLSLASIESLSISEAISNSPRALTSSSSMSHLDRARSTGEIYINHSMRDISAGDSLVKYGQMPNDERAHSASDSGFSDPVLSDNQPDAGSQESMASTSEREKVRMSHTSTHRKNLLTPTLLTGVQPGAELLFVNIFIERKNARKRIDVCQN